MQSDETQVDTPSDSQGFDQNLWQQTGAQHAQLWKAYQPQLQSKIETENRSGLDYIHDIPMGVAAGAEGFVRSVAGLADHVAETFGGDLFDNERLNERVFNTKTWVGGITEGITQFTLGSIPIAGAAGALGKAYNIGKWGTRALKVGAAGLTDFVAFDGTGDRFSNIIVDHNVPILNNAVTRWLAADPNDNFATARVKNALEGFGVGWIADKFIHKLGILKKAQTEGMTPALLDEAEKLRASSEHVATLDRQIDEVAPGNFTTDQKRVGWAMWIQKAKELGENPEDFIKNRLTGIADEAAFHEFAAGGVPTLTQPTKSILEVPDGTKLEMLDWAKKNGFDVEKEVTLADGKKASLSSLGKKPLLEELRKQSAGQPLDLAPTPEAPAATGTIPLKPGEPKTGHMSPEEISSLADENRQALANSEHLLKKPLPNGDELAAETASLNAENADATKAASQIPLVESGVSRPAEIPLAEKPSFDPHAIPVESPKPLSAEDLFAKGAVGFVNDTQAMMFLFRNADFSTFAHESFHIWRRLGLAPEAEQVLARAVGLSAGEKWSTDAEEKSARLFENYLATGKAPDPSLEGVFGRTQSWMKSIYDEIQNSDIAATPSKDVQQMFDRMLMGKPASSTELKAASPKPDNGTMTVDQALAESDKNAESQVLMQSARERRLEPPKELQAQAVDSVLNGLKTGVSPVDEVSEMLFGHYNRVTNNAASAQEVVDTITRVFDTAFHRANGGSINHELTLKWTQELFDTMDWGKIPDALAKDVEKVRGIFIRGGAYRMATVNEAVKVKKLGDLVNQLRAAGTPADEAVNAFSKSLHMYEELRAGDDQLSTGIARALDARKIPLTPSAAKLAEIDKTVKTIRDALTDGTNPVSGEKFLAALSAAGDDGALTGILKGLNTFLHSTENVKSPARKVFDSYMEVWMNGLLSGMRTFDGNFVNNAVQMFLSPAEQWVGSLLVKDAAGARREAGLTFMNVMKQSLDFFGLSKTVSEMNENVGHSARGMAWKSLKDDSPILEQTLRATDTPNHAISAENWNVQNDTLAKAINGLGNVVNIPSRLLMTTDEAFKQMTYRARVGAAAILKAEEMGLAHDSDAFRQFVKEYQANSFDAAGRATREDALHFAQEATMTTPLSDGFGKMLQDAAAKSPIVKLFLPFVRTPANIVTRAIQYTPGIGLLNKQMAEMLSHPNPAIRSIAMGRQAIGTMFWTAAIGLVVSGRVTGGGPTDPQERQALLATGWQPYSIVTQGDDGKKNYFSFKRLDPTGMVFGLAADYAENAPHMHDGDVQGLAQAMLLPIANNLTSRTYMQGLSEFVNVMSQPDRKMEKFLQNRVGSHVWNIVNDFNTDPYLRETRSMMDAALKRIPGQSEKLDPKRNIFGEPIQAPMNDSPFAKAMSPVSYSQSVDDNVKTELASLRHGFSQPPRKYQGLDLTLFKNAQGQDAYDAMQQKVGEVKVNGRLVHDALTKLVGSEKYQSYPAPDSADDTTNPRVMAVNRVLAEYRQRAMERTLKEFPEIGNTIKATQKRLTQSPALQQLSQALTQ